MCFLLMLHFALSGMTRGYCPWITTYQVLLPWQQSDNQLLLVVISCRCCYFRQVYWLSRRVCFILLETLRWCCVDCVIHHERDVRDEQHNTCMWLEQAMIE